MTDEGIQLIPLQSIANRTQFICDECNYRAGSRYNLTRHKESLHTVKVVSCPHLFCNEKFPSKFTMKVHLANCFLYCNWDNCDKKYKNKKFWQTSSRTCWKTKENELTSQNILLYFLIQNYVFYIVIHRLILVFVDFPTQSALSDDISSLYFFVV